MRYIVIALRFIDDAYIYIYIYIYTEITDKAKNAYLSLNLHFMKS